jgi:hypothetical protein
MHRETRGKTLEEMAEIFDDEVAFTEHIGATNDRDIENKVSAKLNSSDVQHLEVAMPEK